MKISVALSFLYLSLFAVADLHTGHEDLDAEIVVTVVQEGESEETFVTGVETEESTGEAEDTAEDLPQKRYMRGISESNQDETKRGLHYNAKGTYVAAKGTYAIPAKGTYVAAKGTYVLPAKGTYVNAKGTYVNAKGTYVTPHTHKYIYYVQPESESESESRSYYYYGPGKGKGGRRRYRYGYSGYYGS